MTTDRRRKTRAWFLDSGLHIVVLEENGAQPHCGLTQGQHGSLISHFGWNGHVPGTGMFADFWPVSDGLAVAQGPKGR